MDEYTPKVKILSNAFLNFIKKESLEGKWLYFSGYVLVEDNHANIANTCLVIVNKPGDINREIKE